MITAKCWGHIDPKYGHHRPGYTHVHTLSNEQAVESLEEMSNGAWKDGPRCLLAWPTPKQQAEIRATDAARVAHVARIKQLDAAVLDAGTGGYC